MSIGFLQLQCVERILVRVLVMTKNGLWARFDSNSLVKVIICAVFGFHQHPGSQIFHFLLKLLFAETISQLSFQSQSRHFNWLEDLANFFLSYKLQPCRLINAFFPLWEILTSFSWSMLHFDGILCFKKCCPFGGCN